MLNAPPASKDVKAAGKTMLWILLASACYLLMGWMVDGAAGTWQFSTAGQEAADWMLNLWLPWILLAPLAQWLLRRVQFGPMLHVVRTSLAIFLLLTLSHTGLLLITTRWLAGGGGTIQTTITLLLEEGYLLFDALIFVVMVALTQGLRLRQQVRETGQAVFDLHKELTDSRLQSLKMQLNPHFLFNTLNGLAVLIDTKENDRAREMLGELSNFLRQTLRNHSEKWVTLEQELAFIRQYLRIEQYRFGARLTWFEECEPLALAAKVPPMLLQPLFENAIVHGLADKEGECRLGFECHLYDRFLIFLIFDNGDSFDATSDPLRNGGIGLSNIQARLREVYGDHYSLQIEKKTDGTLVTLKLPSYKDSQF